MRLRMTIVNPDLENDRYEYDTATKAVIDKGKREVVNPMFTESQTKFYLLQGKDRTIAVAQETLENKFGHINGPMKPN